MTFLRDGFFAVNSRFHLAGIYALVALLVRFSAHWTGDDPAGLPLMLAGLFLYIAADSGIYGLLFQAAMPPRQPISFVRWSAALFLPILWLLFKIGLVQAWLIALMATLHQVISGGSLPASLGMVIYWGRPLFDLLTQVLALYSLPLCILSRARREWRPVIRQGLGVFRSSPHESGRLLALLLVITAIEGAVHFTMGPEGDKAPPGPLEGLVTLATAYLSLVAFFAATRVILARFAAGSGETVRSADPETPGPRA